MPRLFLLLALLLPLGADADTLQIPIGQQGASELRLPQFGESQRAVLERFGLADDPLGLPRIQRLLRAQTRDQ